MKRKYLDPNSKFCVPGDKSGQIEEEGQGDGRNEVEHHQVEPTPEQEQFDHMSR